MLKLTVFFVFFAFFTIFASALRYAEQVGDLEENDDGVFFFKNNGRYPYVIDVYRGDSSYTGVLIREDVVLTVALGIAGWSPKEMFLTAGMTYRWDNKLPGVQQIHVRKIILHKGFDNKLDRNIALMFTTAPFKVTEFVRPIKMAPASTQLNQYEGKPIRIMGWGENENGIFADDLQHISGRVMNFETCKSIFERTVKNKDLAITERMACVKGEPEKATVGRTDQGDPVVLNQDENPENDVLLGIVSYGLWDGENPAGILVTSVPALRSWIDGKIRIEDKKYTHIEI